MEILFWSAGNQRVTDWWHAAAENGVHKKWPHITVNSVVFPPGGREDKLVTAAAAGNPPDFSVGHSTILNRLAQLGAVAPLDSSISQHKVPMQDYLPYHVAAGQFDGKQYGLCAYGGFFHTGFNKSLLDSKGAVSDAGTTRVSGLATVAGCSLPCATQLRRVAHPGRGADSPSRLPSSGSRESSHPWRGCRRAS